MRDLRTKPEKIGKSLAGTVHREEFGRDSTVKEYEDELRINDKEEGITSVHV
jgi:hypothetical protein